MTLWFLVCRQCPCLLTSTCQHLAQNDMMFSTYLAERCTYFPLGTMMNRLFGMMMNRLLKISHWWCLLYGFKLQYTSYIWHGISLKILKYKMANKSIARSKQLTHQHIQTVFTKLFWYHIYLSEVLNHIHIAFLIWPTSLMYGYYMDLISNTPVKS